MDGERAAGAARLAPVWRQRAWLLLPVPFIAWFARSLAAGEARWELCIPALLAPALAYGGDAARRLLVRGYPLALVGILYDAQGLLGPPSGVHACDLEAADRWLFGVGSGAARVTLPEWLQRHPSPALDLVAAVPYGTFIYASIAFALWLFFRRDPTALPRFAWTFLALNALAFATYRLYPAAPPWYVHAHGCAIDLGASASQGPGLQRVDALLGVPYFQAFYGRSEDVFGAVPSLHVGYPLLLLLEGSRHLGRPGRAAIGLYFLSMCFAAVYLDHHWVIDVVLGLGYAGAAYGAVAWALARRRRGLPVGRPVFS